MNPQTTNPAPTPPPSNGGRGTSAPPSKGAPDATPPFPEGRAEGGPDTSPPPSDGCATGGPDATAASLDTSQGGVDSVGWFLGNSAGAALVLAPVLLFAGMMASPPQASESTADYIAALARDSFMTELSAILLHYGLIAGALGVLAVPGLTRGAKGRWLTAGGALAAALGMLNVSGAVRDDWWRMVLGQRLGTDAASGVSDLVDAAAFMPAWSGTEVFTFLGLLALCAGLARARVAGWWLTAVFAGAFAGMSFVPIRLTYVAGALFTLLFLPLGVAGVRLLRGRA